MDKKKKRKLRVERRNRTRSGHGEGCDHSSPKSSSRKLWWVLAICGSYMVAEIVGGYLSGSLALLADAGHMAVDSVAVALGLFAIWVSQKPPTLEKTFGYYRAEVLVALVNSVALLVASGLIFMEAWPRFHSPPEVQGSLMTWIAGGGLVVNLISLKLTHAGKGHNLNMRGVWLHILGDTLGSVGALTAAFLIWKFQWYLADPIISVLIAAMIVLGAVKLLMDCMHVLFESVPKDMSLSHVRQGLLSHGSVLEVHDLHIWMVSNGLVSLSAHVKIQEGVDSAEVLRDLTTYLATEHDILHVTLQLEPPDFTHRDMHPEW